jgi:RHS repeat-associated protein
VLGSVRAISDATGALAGNTDYDVFGTVRREEGVKSMFGFTGEPTDPGGLAYLRARYLDPSLGRFLSADPVQPGLPGSQGYNHYTYVGNNPTTLIDPTGQEAIFEYTIAATYLDQAEFAVNLSKLNSCLLGESFRIVQAFNGYLNQQQVDEEQVVRKAFFDFIIRNNVLTGIQWSLRDVDALGVVETSFGLARKATLDETIHVALVLFGPIAKYQDDRPDAGSWRGAGGAAKAALKFGFSVSDQIRAVQEAIEAAERGEYRTKMLCGPPNVP